MNDYHVIVDAGRSLVRLLWNEIRNDPELKMRIDSEDRISLESPFTLRDSNSARLSVYLYHVFSDPVPKVRPPILEPGGKPAEPPLVLNLLYLVTPMSGTTVEQQLTLGKVMQIFHRNPVLPSQALVGSLAGSSEQPRVTASPLTLEETARIWQSLAMSHRQCACYTVRLVMAGRD